MQAKSETENGKKQTFFEQFQEFGLQLQNETSNLKRELETKPGSHPKQYDQGMRVLKSEIHSIKDMIEETKEKVIQVQRFSHFVESTKDLINAQKDDVITIENYLKRYGYKPPVSKENFEQCFDTTITDTDENEKDDRNVPGEILSPELSDVGKSVLQGKNVSVNDNFGVSLKPPELNVELIAAATPVQKPKPKWCTPTPMSSRKRLEQWIVSVEAANASETPILRKDIQRTLSFTEDSPIVASIVQRKAMKIATEGKCTSDEPLLSSITTSLMHEEPSISPEEPTLSEIGSSFVRRLYKVEETTTPEEPYLQAQTVEQGRSNIQSNGYQYGSLPPTPKSPQLSDITQKILNVKHLHFTEEEHEDNKKFKAKYNEKSLIIKEPKTSTVSEPESPQLSDVTLKILGRKF